MRRQNQTKKIFSCILLSILIFCSYGVSAQNLRKRFSIGFGLEGGLPEGDAKDIYSATAGLTIRFSYRLGHGFATFTTGGIGYAPKVDEINQKAGVQFPFKAGYKYIICRHLFIMGEAGYSAFRAYYRDPIGKLLYTDKGGFTYAPAVGVQFGALELGVRYETLQAGGLNIAHAGVRLGFNF
jgi:hypothetical protein